MHVGPSKPMCVRSFRYIPTRVFEIHEVHFLISYEVVELKQHLCQVVEL